MRAQKKGNKNPLIVHNLPKMWIILSFCGGAYPKFGMIDPKFRGVRYKFEIFLRQETNFKKQEIIYHSIEKRFPKFGIFFGLENIFILLLYTTSDYYGNRSYNREILSVSTDQKIRVHLSYTIIHSIP